MHEFDKDTAVLEACKMISTSFVCADKNRSCGKRKTKEHKGCRPSKEREYHSCIFLHLFKGFELRNSIVLINISIMDFKNSNKTKAQVYGSVLHFYHFSPCKFSFLWLCRDTQWLKITHVGKLQTFRLCTVLCDTKFAEFGLTMKLNNEANLTISFKRFYLKWF